MTGILLGPRWHLTGGAGGGGGTVGTVALANDLVEGLNSAKWFLGADGYTYRNALTEANRGPVWINPQVGMEQFEVMVSLEPGSDPLDKDDGLDVWLSPVTSPGWGYGGAGGAEGGTLNVQIRRLSDAVVVDTATIDLSKEGTLTGGGGVNL